jgi:hypothetical protein
MKTCDCPECSPSAIRVELPTKRCPHIGTMGIEDCVICSPKEAIRVERDYRFDILDPSFILAMAKIGHLGARLYGDLNWQKNHLEGGKGSINHIYAHISKFQRNEPYDHLELGSERKYHLAAIAFNAMMEFWWEEHPQETNKPPLMCEGNSHIYRSDCDICFCGKSGIAKS